MSAPRMYRRRTAWVAAVVVLVLLYHFLSLRSDLDPPQLDTRPKTPSSQSQSQSGSGDDGQTRQKAGSGGHDISKAHQEAESKPVCPPLPGMEDVLVVMKTGVTEAKDKVPVHFQTTLRCVPNYVIYSDFDEEIQGVQLHDALRNMDEGIKQSIPDFNIYNRIRSMGRAGLNSADFADVANSALGKPDNPGWKLDKWKFLPMVQETYAHKPDAKWYVFMEADTYFSWGTLLAWLAQLNHNDPLYIGTETQIADVIFAHGGSGFIISNPALKRVVNDYAKRPAEIHAYTANHWAGDCVLGKILLDNGVPLTFSWPMLQNSHPGELDEFATVFYRKPWCFPAVAFHHLSPSDVQSLWEFEQKRFKDNRKTLLLHSDVYRERLYPEFAPERSNWDNLSGDVHSASVDTYEDCHALCASVPTCMQFSWRDNRCFTNNTPRLGQSSKGAKSGWIMRRVDAQLAAAPTCKKPDFG